MYYYGQESKTSIILNKSYEGESIEKKIERILANGEPIKDGAPLAYTDRSKGVLPEYNIRTDRFEIAVEATGHIAKSKLAERQSFLTKDEDVKDESTDATADNLGTAPDA